MRLRRLGDSELEVSEISLGSWLTYSGGIEREQTEACTRAAFDAGINFFDTANVYGDRRRPRRPGARSSRTTTATPTCSRPRSTSRCRRPTSGCRREQIAKQIDASLARLRTDYVDLYQCHRFDPEVAIEETMEALTEVVEAGKARYLGFSEWTPEQIRAGARGAGARRSSSPRSRSTTRSGAPPRPRSSASARSTGSRRSSGRRSPRACYRQVPPGREPPADSRAASDEMSFAIERYMDDAVLEAVERLRPIAEDAGLSMVELALAWVLRRAEVAAAIIGASRPEQVHANAAASGVELSADTLAAIDEALGGVAITEPAAGASFAREGVKHRE